VNDCCCADRTQIIALLNKYATCLDSREWTRLDEVFHSDARAHYGSPSDHATSTTQARVIHLGAGERERLTPYEAIGTYHDQHIRTVEGWRIISRRFDVRISTGEIAVLQPG
jgi:3-phenylpropionate/cinnamic acid dioxygenase small subunit